MPSLLPCREPTELKHRGHDDHHFSRSRHVINHVTIRFATYWWSNGTEPLSLTVFEIFVSKYICGMILAYLRSRNVIGHVTRERRKGRDGRRGGRGKGEEGKEGEGGRKGKGRRKEEE